MRFSVNSRGTGVIMVSLVSLLVSGALGGGLYAMEPVKLFSNLNRVSQAVEAMGLAKRLLKSHKLKEAELRLRAAAYRVRTAAADLSDEAGLESAVLELEITQDRLTDGGVDISDRLVLASCSLGEGIADLVRASRLVAEDDIEREVALDVLKLSRRASSLGLFEVVEGVAAAIPEALDDLDLSPGAISDLRGLLSEATGVLQNPKLGDREKDRALTSLLLAIEAVLS